MKAPGTAPVTALDLAKKGYLLCGPANSDPETISTPFELGATAAECY
jgi:hypothetical protein